MTEATLTWTAEEPSALDEPKSLARQLLDPEQSGARILSQRLRFGLAFAFSLGAAMDLGGVSEGVLGSNALVFPLTLLAGVLLCLPGLYILLTLCDSELGLEALVQSAARSLCASGLAAAAAAPVVALYALTTESATITALLGLFGLLASGTVALGSFVRSMLRQHRRQSLAVQARLSILLFGFVVFAVLLNLRLWTNLPVWRWL